MRYKKCTVKADYNNPLTTEEEQKTEALHDYVRTPDLSEIEFKAYVDMVSGAPTVVSSSSGSTVEVKLPKILKKEY